MSRRFGSENVRTPHAQRHPTQRELGWIAGFLEGEACFGPNGGYQRIVVEQVQREPFVATTRTYRWGSSDKLPFDERRKDGVDMEGDGPASPRSYVDVLFALVSETATTDSNRVRGGSGTADFSNSFISDIEALTKCYHPDYDRSAPTLSYRGSDFSRARPSSSTAP